MPPNPQTTSRARWVDCARGLGIVLVVYGHVARGVAHAGIGVDPSAFAAADAVIYSFHMPLFFFLSGLFFVEARQRDGWVGTVAARVDTVVYPYIVWSLLHGALEVLLAPYTNGEVTWREVLALLWAPRAHFWFLYALFLLCLLGATLYGRATVRWCWVVFAAAFALAWAQQVHPLVGEPLNFVAIEGVYFALGPLFIRWAPWLQAHAGRLVGPLGLFFVVGQWLTHVEPAQAPLFMQHGAVWPLLLAIGSIGFVTVLAMWLARPGLQAATGWLAHLGAASMAIYLMHVLAASAVRVGLQHGLKVTDPTAHLLAGTVAGLVLPLVAHALLRRWGWGTLFEPPASWSARAWWRRRVGSRVAAA